MRTRPPSRSRSSWGRAEPGSPSARRSRRTEPIYQRTAACGHFGRAPEKDGGFSWEKTDLADAIKKAMG